MTKITVSPETENNADWSVANAAVTISFDAVEVTLGESEARELSQRLNAAIKWIDEQRESRPAEPPEADATPDEAFELGEVSGYDKGYADALGEFSVPNSSPETSHLIALARARQIAKGYTAERDAQHGVPKLLEWSARYAEHGQHIQAAAMVDAARALLTQSDKGADHA